MIVVVITLKLESDVEFFVYRHQFDKHIRILGGESCVVNQLILEIKKLVLIFKLHEIV